MGLHPTSRTEPRVMILLRHGQSSANAGGVFSGWLDVPLTTQGEQEAIRAGKLLAVQGLRPDVVHTSVLRRSIRTAELALDALARPWTPIQRTWRLNERHYGALQGRSKVAVGAEVGDREFLLWRRSYEVAPPPLAEQAATAIRTDPRYATLPSDALPVTEALVDVRRRVVPYWEDILAIDIHGGRVPLVVAHGNSLRALCMHLDGLSPREVTELNIPTGVPLRYDLDAALRPIVRGGTYLDPVAAAAGSAEVAAQGIVDSA
jgi:2,3-bisphosphoglycerate-dependent phosphoglycerate mutase